MDIRISTLLTRCLLCEYCNETSGICRGCGEGFFFMQKDPDKVNEVTIEKIIQSRE